MFLLHTFASSQIWLNCLNHDGNQCIITKLEKEHWFGPLNICRGYVEWPPPQEVQKEEITVFDWPIWWVIFNIVSYFAQSKFSYLWVGMGEKHNMLVVRNTYKGPNNHRCGWRCSNHTRHYERFCTTTPTHKSCILCTKSCNLCNIIILM